jgi:catechol 2,3-dioxygenase-like lactoylglutathione lyase family enzyme
MTRVVYDHTGFVTPSLEVSVRFWTEILGFQVHATAVRAKPWIATLMGVPGANISVVHLRGHGARIEFIEFIKADDGAGLPPASLGSHICLWVDDLAGLRDRILSGGGSIQGEMVEITEGSLAGRRGLYLKDPHGIIIELVELKEDDLGEHA